MAYYRLQHRCKLFDEITCLSVEGVNKSTISRVKGTGWNTVHRWLERAGEMYLRFNENNLGGFELKRIPGRFVSPKRIGMELQPMFSLDFHT